MKADSCLSSSSRRLRMLSGVLFSSVILFSSALVSVPAVVQAAEGVASSTVVTDQSKTEDAAIRTAIEALRVKRLEGTFREEKTIAGFPKPMVSTGRFELAPGKLVWEIVDPFPSVTTIDDNGIRFDDGLGGDADNGSVEDDTAANPQAAQTAKILTGLLSGDPEALEGLFALKELPKSDGKTVIEAVPKHEALSQFVKKAVFTGREYVENVTLEGANGDITRIRLSNVKAQK